MAVKDSGKYGHIKDFALRKSLTNSDRQIRSRYGISLEERDLMAEKQKHKCKICNKNKRLVIEHNHENGKIRGLTCDRCNSLLGHLEEIGFDLLCRANMYLITDGYACHPMEYTNRMGITNSGKKRKK